MREGFDLRRWERRRGKRMASVMGGRRLIYGLYETP
jgi:hypothetical protein